MQLFGLPQVEVELTVESRGFLPLARKANVGDELVLRLERGTLLQGHIRGPAGVPVVAARVGPPGQTTTRRTTEVGFFEIVVAKLPAELEVQAEGFRSTRSTVRDEAPVEIELSAIERLTGLAVDDRGQPVQAVEIWFDRVIEVGSHRSRQNEVETVEGRFAVDLDGPGRYRVRVTSPGFRPAVLGGLVVTAGETLDLGVVTLERGAGFRGRALDERSGNGLSGVDVTALPVGTALLDALRLRSLPRATSDGQGNFLLTGLPAGGYELRFSRSGYADAVERRTLDRGDVENLGEIALDRGVPVRGRVTGRDGGSRAGVTVRLSSPEGDSLLPLVEVITGGDGRFGPVSLAAGRYRAEVRRQRSLLVQEVTVPATAVSAVEWELVVQGVHLLGRVSRAGRPVSAGTVTLASALDPTDQRGKVLLTAPDFGPGSAGWGLPEVATVAVLDAEGRFEVEDVPAGQVYLTVYDAAGTTTREAQIADDVRVEIHLELDGARLDGRLIDRATGEGLANGLVELVDPGGHELGQVATGEDGAFRFEHVASGRYQLLGSARDHASQLVELEVGDELPPPVEIALERENVAEIVVRLRYPTGEPAAGVPVTLLDGAGRMVRSLPTDGDGERIFRDLNPGSYFLAWTDGLGGTGGLGPLEARSGRPALVERGLGVGQSVVLTGSDSAWRGAAVEDLALLGDGMIPLGPQLPALGLGTRFSAEGRLPLGKLAPGLYRLEIRRAGQSLVRDFAVGSTPVEVDLP